MPRKIIIELFQKSITKFVTPQDDKVIFMISSSFTIIALMTAITITSLTYAKQDLPSSPPPPATTFSFATAGDWGSNTNARQTANNIISHHEPLVIGLGDYCYCGSPHTWWNSVIFQLKGVMFRGAEGNHEISDSGKNASQLLKDFGQKNWTTSFNYKNVHFVILDEEHGKLDGNTLDKDLATARADPAIKWIVVAFHEPIYTSPSDHAPDENGIKSTVLPLIDKYHVDLVLQAHNHNYQRSFPLQSDKVTGNNTNSVYQSPKGTMYMLVGTGGQGNYALRSQANYVQKQFTGTYGFLKVDISDTTLIGSFIANDGTIKDTFTINK